MRGTKNKRDWKRENEEEMEGEGDGGKKMEREED